jgi:hypothetical protein
MDAEIGASNPASGGSARLAARGFTNRQAGELMVQTPGQIQSVDFETAVMQALVSAAKAAGTH